jgi:hypothetical protein
MKLVFSALAVAMVLGSASAAVAAQHKSGTPKARAANAQASSQIDPRAAYKPKGTNHGTWCDNSADCNGWAQWLIEVQENKLKADKNVYPLH